MTYSASCRPTHKLRFSIVQDVVNARIQSGASAQGPRPY